MGPLVTVITPTTGSALLEAALDSVAEQTYKPIQHLVVVDGAERSEAARKIIAARSVDVIELPYPTGTNKYNGHRIYGAATFLCRGDLVCFLDEDNWMDKDHLASLVAVLKDGNEWAFSLRKIVDQSGQYICRDDCESLGKWPTFLSPEDYLVDVNCFLLPKELAVKFVSIWYRRMHQPGVVPIDRRFTQVLRAMTVKYDTSYR